MNVRTLRQENGFYTKTELAKEAGIEVHNLYYMIKCGVIAPPTHKLNKSSSRRFYFAEEYKEILSRLKK